jgi:hypothetical protein
MAIKKEEVKENKTVFYMMRTIDVLVENQKILLSRIKKLEDAMDMLAEQVYEDDEDYGDDRILN